MSVYVAFCYDRHRDPVIRVFDDRERANAFARGFMEDNMAHSQHITHEMHDGLYRGNYELEEDRAYVEAAELNSESY